MRPTALRLIQTAIAGTARTVIHFDYIFFFVSVTDQSD